MARDGNIRAWEGTRVRLDYDCSLKATPNRGRNQETLSDPLFDFVSLAERPGTACRSEGDNGTRGRGQVIQNTIIVVEGGTKAAGA